MAFGWLSELSADFFLLFLPNAEPVPRLDVFVAVAVGPASFRTLLDVRYKSFKVKFLDSRTEVIVDEYGFNLLLLRLLTHV